MLLKLIHTIFFYFLTILSFFFGATAPLFLGLSKKDKQRPFLQAAQAWAKFLILFSGCKIKVFGRENLPKNQAVILVANHQGAADIPILLAKIPILFRFAIKKELFQIPIFGWYLKKAGYFSIDRKLVLSAYRTVEQITKIIKLGGSVLIFPEGTRTKTGQLGRFKRGSLLAALKSGAPIVPIAISGSFKILPRGTYLLNPQKVKLSIGQPVQITSEEDYDNKLAQIRSTIEKML